MRTADARAIADRTVLLIEQLDRADTPTEVKRLCGDWFAWADGAHVCRQIREHVAEKRKLLLAEMGDRPRPVDGKSRAAAADR